MKSRKLVRLMEEAAIALRAVVVSDMSQDDKIKAADSLLATVSHISRNRHRLQTKRAGADLDKVFDSIEMADKFYQTSLAAYQAARNGKLPAVVNGIDVRTCDRVEAKIDANAFLDDETHPSDKPESGGC